MEIPLLAHAEYFLHYEGISQRLIYAYDDPEYVYLSAKKKGTLSNLLKEVSENLQTLINTEDKSFLDNEELKWTVNGVILDFWGDDSYPFLTYSLTTNFRLAPGKHVLRFYTPISRLQYNISAVWLFPPYIKPLKFETRMDASWQSNIIHLWAHKNAVVGGWENFEFEVLSL